MCSLDKTANGMPKSDLKCHVPIKMTLIGRSTK